MKPNFINGNIIAQCPSNICQGSLTTYERVYGGKTMGEVVENSTHLYKGITYPMITWSLNRCASCGAGGMAKIHCNTYANGQMESFYPFTVSSQKLPLLTPEHIKSEFREAEKCASIECYRAASAMIRSTLEKILKDHQYNSGGLEKKINDVMNDGIITTTQGKRAHQNVRVLGNDVLHEDWKEISADEVNQALSYTQRIAESFYDDPESVKAILEEKSQKE